jgi:sec-independent protein translocase protein TatA
MPGNIGPLEIAIVLIIALLVFGPKRLPELGKSVGKGIREFKGSISGENDDKQDDPPDEQAQIAAADPTPPPAEREDEKSKASVGRDSSA